MTTDLQEAKPATGCQRHYEDNQGRCHECGVLLNEDRWASYTRPSEKPRLRDEGSSAEDAAWQPLER